MYTHMNLFCSYQVGSCSQSCQALTLDDTLSFGELKEMHTKLNKVNLNPK